MDIKKQTAVEYLEEIYLTTGIDRNIHFWKAKQIEKERMITFAHSVLKKWNQTTDFFLNIDYVYDEIYGGADE